MEGLAGSQKLCRGAMFEFSCAPGECGGRAKVIWAVGLINVSGSNSLRRFAFTKLSVSLVGAAWTFCAADPPTKHLPIFAATRPGAVSLKFAGYHWKQSELICSMRGQGRKLVDLKVAY